jgi:hypothetical protein
MKLCMSVNSIIMLTDFNYTYFGDGILIETCPSYKESYKESYLLHVQMSFSLLYCLHKKQRQLSQETIARINIFFTQQEALKFKC